MYLYKRLRCVSRPMLQDIYNTRNNDNNNKITVAIMIMTKIGVYVYKVQVGYEQS